MINSDSGPIFAQQVSGGQRAEARRALQDIQDRHQDIVRIERSIIVSNISRDETHTRKENHYH